MKKRWKKSSRSEREALAELRKELRNKLKGKRRAEAIKNKRKERERKRLAFVKNPFKFTSDMLEKKRSGTLKCPQEEVEEHLKKTHSDPRRNEPLGECELIRPQPEPSVDFDLREPTLAELIEVVK